MYSCMTEKAKIEDYIQENDVLHIFLIGVEEPLLVPEHKFMKWAKENDKLSWTTDEIYNGSHRQQSGTMSEEEYWQMDYRIIKGDIAEYVTKHHQ